MFILNSDLKKLLKQIHKANRRSKQGEPMSDFTLVVKDTDSSGPRIKIISGTAPVSFWKNKQTENIMQ
jgi:hypothetical protein